MILRLLARMILRLLEDGIFVGGFGVGLSIAGIVFSVVLAVTGDTRNDGIRETRAAAIEAGVAHFVVDPRTGETSFEFIRPKE